MTFPNYPGKYNSKPVISPRNMQDYYDTSTFPENVILVYEPDLMNYVENNYEVSEDHILGGVLYRMNGIPGSVGVLGKFGFGAPATVTISEVLIVMGVKRLINIGIAGSLQKHIDIGDIVVCDKAIRDEGTSYHYLPPDTYAFPHPGLTNLIVKTIDKKGAKYFTGPSWTIDTPYRETIVEVSKYQEEGILTVEMEASALFALGKYRNIEIGAIFTISDSLADLKWRPEFNSEKTAKGLEMIFKVALDTLSTY